LLKQVAARHLGHRISFHGASRAHIEPVLKRLVLKLPSALSTASNSQKPRGSGEISLSHFEAMATFLLVLPDEFETSMCL
jgi:hypothetical protein